MLSSRSMLASCASALLAIAIPGVSFAAQAVAYVPRNLQPSVPTELRQRQQRMVDAMSDITTWRFYSDGRLEHVAGNLRLRVSERIVHLERGAAAPELVDLLGPLFLAAGTEELTAETNDELRKGFRHGRPWDRAIRLRESIRGRPVVESFVELLLDGERIVSIRGNFLPDRELVARPRVSSDDAVRAVNAIIAKLYGVDDASIELQGQPTLGYVFPRFEYGLDAARLVWIVEASYRTTDFECRASLSIDTGNGSLAHVVTPSYVGMLWAPNCPYPKVW